MDQKFPQLILTTGSQNIGPYITVYYGIWTCVSTKIPKIYCESDRLQKMHSLSVLQIIFGEGSLSVFGRDKWSQKFYFVKKIFWAIFQTFPGRLNAFIEILFCNFSHRHNTSNKVTNQSPVATIVPMRASVWLLLGSDWLLC